MTPAPFLIVAEHQHQQHSHQRGQAYQKPQAGCIRARMRQLKAFAVVDRQGNVVHARGGIVLHIAKVSSIALALSIRCQRKLDGIGQQSVAVGGFGC